MQILYQKESADADPSADPSIGKGSADSSADRTERIGMKDRRLFIKNRH